MICKVDLAENQVISNTVAINAYKSLNMNFVNKPLKPVVLGVVTLTTAKSIDKDIKSQKGDDCSKDENINNPPLRKKICLKMSKIIQDRYNLEVKIARDLTIKIENKIRLMNPDMKQEYRDKILIILRLLKVLFI